MPATAPPEGGSPPATATVAGGGRSWGRRAVDGLRGAVGREAGGAAVVSVFVLGSTIGLALVAGLFLDPPVRPDHVVYGRYLEILAPPVLAQTREQIRPVTATLVALAGAAILLALARRPRVWALLGLAGVLVAS